MNKNLQEKLRAFEYVVEEKIGRINGYFYNKKMKNLYPDYEDDSYNLGSLKFIFGVRSCDDLSDANASFDTMNDFDIYYERKTETYSLGIETAYCFEEPRKENECKYLAKLLDIFTSYMDKNNLDKTFNLCLFCRQPEISNEAESIEELYAKFKLFVLGYCALYNYVMK